MNTGADVTVTAIVMTTIVRHVVAVVVVQQTTSIGGLTKTR